MALKIFGQIIVKRVTNTPCSKIATLERLLVHQNLTIDFTELKTVLNCNSVGQVIINGDTLANGFAIKTDNTTYFGTLSDNTVIELCIAQWNDNTTKEILEIDKAFNLLFVNWYHCDLIKND